jgi:hypothetical protein
MESEVATLAAAAAIAATDKHGSSTDGGRSSSIMSAMSPSASRASAMPIYMGSSVFLQNSMREEAILAKEPTYSSSAERARELRA